MNILEEIGLTKKEAEIYQLLLRLGEVPISTIQKETGSHPQVIYRTIESLSEKGLVMESVKRHRKYVSAEHPKKLEKIETDRLQRLQKALPELITNFKPSKKAKVRTLKGDESIRAIRSQAIDSLKRNQTLYILGGSGDRFYEALGERYEDIEKKRVKKKIHKKLIAFESERKKLMKDKYRELSEFRYLPEDFPVGSSTNIFGDTVALFVWAPEPITIVIESSDVAKSYIQYFNQFWKLGSP